MEALYIIFIFSLTQHIGGQQEGINILMKYIESWELSKCDGVSDEPLVLVITGPTGELSVAVYKYKHIYDHMNLGVGKSETAVRLSEALLQPNSRILRNKLPPGLLLLHGGDFSESSSIVRNHVDGVKAVCVKRV